MVKYGCLWRAADTPPLEGLSILRCAFLRSCARVAHFKNCVFRNGGIEFNVWRCVYVSIYLSIYLCVADGVVCWSGGCWNLRCTLCRWDVQWAIWRRKRYICLEQMFGWCISPAQSWKLASPYRQIQMVTGASRDSCKFELLQVRGMHIHHACQKTQL